jgi:hypothetical protein
LSLTIASRRLTIASRRLTEQLKEKFSSSRRTQCTPLPKFGARLEHYWSRADANGSNEWQSRIREIGSTAQQLSPLAVVSCAHNDMVRRGSTVRVRQRALKVLQIAISCCLC